jgi:HK97 family phage major capsid protein
MHRKCTKCGTEKPEDQFRAADAVTCTDCEEADAAPPWLRTLFTEMDERDKKREEELERKVTDAVAKIANSGEPSTPSLRTESGLPIEIRDEFDQRGYTPADFELARLIMGGVGPRLGVAAIEPSDRFMQAYRANVNVGRIMVSRDGTPVRAMDSAETGFGLELIGAQYVRDLWAAARNTDSLVGRIREIPMTDPTTYIPIDGALPEMLFVGESTSASAAAYTTSKTASNRVTLSAKKFTIQQIWSGELDEDSIITFTPFLRERLNMSASLHLGSAYYNGDTTNAGTGNINLNDADPADTKHYLAWDGIRHYWLVDATGQGKNMAAALDFGEINVARGKLNGADDDIDAAVGNINWGSSASDLLLVADWDTYMAMLDGDKVTTVDKYGAGATIVTGELGRVYGIPIVSPSYATKTDTDGKAVNTESTNSRGQISVFNPMGFLGGARRDVQLFFDRIQRTDQFLFELYTRRAFTRFGGNVSAGVYNITL